VSLGFRPRNARERGAEVDSDDDLTLADGELLEVQFHVSDWEVRALGVVGEQSRQRIRASRLDERAKAQGC